MKTGKLVFNGEYYVMRHFSQYVRPRTRRLLSTGPWCDKIAFRNVDGTVVLVVGNSSKKPQPVAVRFARMGGNDTLNVELPAESIDTFVVRTQCRNIAS